MQFKNFPYQNNESGQTKKQNSNNNNHNNTTTETKIYREKKTSENTKYEMKSKSISVQMMDIYQRLNITQLVK